MGFPGGNEPACNAGDAGAMGSIPGSGRSPGGVHGKPHQCSLPGESHGQRNLAGYSPWGHKESDMTEQAHARRCLDNCIMTNISGKIHRSQNDYLGQGRDWNEHTWGKFGVFLIKPSKLVYIQGQPWNSVGGLGVPALNTPENPIILYSQPSLATIPCPWI